MGVREHTLLRTRSVWPVYACVIFDKNSFIDAACTRSEIILPVLY